MTHSSDISDTIDLLALLDRVGGDEELLDEICRIFLDEAPKLLDDIRTAVTSNSDRGLMMAAHSLKGAISNFGVDSATNAAWELERIGRENQLDRAPGALSILEDQVCMLTTALGRGVRR